MDSQHFTKKDFGEISEHIETSSNGIRRPLDIINLEALDSIEQTPTGKFSWLASLTAGERRRTHLSPIL
jgi:hypothetical protein